MTKITATYKGDLRVESVHSQSETILITDAPLDNAGKGESFSPTDLCATALGSCVLTTMGIYAQKSGIDIEGATAEIEKVMTTEAPRRIAEISVKVQMPNKAYSDKEKLVLERTAHTCAVHNTLKGAVEMDIKISW